MRSFVAISLSDETKAAFVSLQRELPVGRPVTPENMHLTLVFLDDQPEEKLEEFHEEVLKLSSSPFAVNFLGIECYGQVLAVGVADCPALTALQRKIKSAARRTGIMLPRRRFRPHVTIARLKPKQREEVQHSQCPRANNPLPEMLVTGFTLYHSTLRPEGARHDALAYYCLS